jgi:hypothetical protein
MIVARKLNAARALPVQDWALFVEAWAQLLVADFSVRFVPFQRLRRTLQPNSAPGNADGATVERVTRLFSIAARNHVTPVNCLRRSLALRALLLRRGIPAVMRVGARTADGSLLAHAWVEVGGKVVGESERTVGEYEVFRES